MCFPKCICIFFVSLTADLILRSQWLSSTLAQRLNWCRASSVLRLNPVSDNLIQFGTAEARLMSGPQSPNLPSFTCFSFIIKSILIFLKFFFKWIYFLIEIEICNNLMTNQLWFWNLSRCAFFLRMRYMIKIFGPRLFFSTPSPCT